MEVIAAASSILTITAAVGQGVSVAKRLHDLLEDFRNAPEEIRAELEQLETTALMLRELEDSQSTLSPQTQSLGIVIQRCHASIHDLETILQASRTEIESKRKLTRLRGHLHTVWGEKRIEKFRKTCVQAKSDLLLAMNLSLMYCFKQAFPTSPPASQNPSCALNGTEGSQSDFKAISVQKVGKIKWRRKIASHANIFKTILASLELTEAVMNIYSPRWMTRFRFRLSIGISFATLGYGCPWKVQLDISTRVADSFKIFDLIRRGDGKGVRKFLKACPAAANVRDSYDWAPLHWAILLRRLSVCKTLLAYGAKADAFIRVGHSSMKVKANQRVATSIGSFLWHRSLLELPYYYEKWRLTVGRERAGIPTKHLDRRSFKIENSDLKSATYSPNEILEILRTLEHAGVFKNASYHSSTVSRGLNKLLVHLSYVRSVSCERRRGHDVSENSISWNAQDHFSWMINCPAFDVMRAVEKDKGLMFSNLLYAARLDIPQLEVVLLRMTRDVRAKASSGKQFHLNRAIRNLLQVADTNREDIQHVFFLNQSDLRILHSLGASLHDEWQENSGDLQRKLRATTWTLTSYAMSSSIRFARWQEILIKYYEVNLEDFVNRELNGGKGLLAQRGWTTNTLLALLRARFNEGNSCKKELLKHRCRRCNSRFFLDAESWRASAIEQLRLAGNDPVVDNTASTWYSWRPAVENSCDGLGQNDEYVYIWQMKGADGNQYTAQIPKKRLHCARCRQQPKGRKFRPEAMKIDRRDKRDKRHARKRRLLRIAKIVIFFSPLRIFLSLCCTILWHIVVIYARRRTRGKV